MDSQDGQRAFPPGTLLRFRTRHGVYHYGVAVPPDGARPGVITVHVQHLSKTNRRVERELMSQFFNGAAPGAVIEVVPVPDFVGLEECLRRADDTRHKQGYALIPVTNDNCETYARGLVSNHSGSTQVALALVACCGLFAAGRR
jgi:hypothetical protein